VPHIYAKRNLGEHVDTQQQLTSEIFRLPPGAAARITQDCSVITSVPSGFYAIHSTLVALRLLGVSSATVAAALNVTTALLARWRQGNLPVPESRQAELREVLRLAIGESQRSVDALDRLPQTGELQRLRTILLGRLDVARKALADAA
jgi:hypothetical protein